MLPVLSSADSLDAPSLITMESSENLHAQRTGGLPNCLVIGAGKAGSTFIWDQLGQHPEIYMYPRKQLNYFSYEDDEPRFRGPPPFNVEVCRTVEEYRVRFPESSKFRVVGEASNSYMYSSIAAGRIRATLPNVKLIAVLRHPADRAYSRYLQMVQSGRESAGSFVDALQREDERVREYWWPDFHYVRMGRYYEQLKRYLDHFSRDRLFVCLFDDLHQDHRRVIGQLYSFVGVDPTFVPDGRIRYSVSGLARSTRLYNSMKLLKSWRPLIKNVLNAQLYKEVLLVGSLIQRANLVKPNMPEFAREWVIARCRDDVQELERLLGRDLSHWRTL
jgi:hypothetical protein